MMQRGIVRQLPSDPAAVGPLCLELAQLLEQQGLARHLFGIELIARELLNNAIFHGNRESPTKQVDFCLIIGRRWIRMSVADQGSGYNWRRLQRNLADPEATSGRGIAITRLYAQRLRFSRNGKKIEVWFDREGGAPFS